MRYNKIIALAGQPLEYLFTITIQNLKRKGCLELPKILKHIDILLDRRQVIFPPMFENFSFVL